MMLSMHSILRDRFRRRAMALDLLLLAGSAVMCATSLVDRAVLERSFSFGASLGSMRASTAVGLFVLSLFSLRLDWKERAGRHGKACDALARLKASTRGWIDMGLANVRESPGVGPVNAPDYPGVMAQLEPIPESKFVALKAAHKRKLLLSRMIDDHPAAPIWILSLRLFARDTVAFLKR